MKVMVCADLLVGDVGALGMSPKRLAQWQEDKIEALAAALEEARGKGADACVIAGGLFSRGFVPQGLLQETIEEASCHNLFVHYVPADGEALDLESRISIPTEISVLRGDRIEPIPGICVLRNGFEKELIIKTASGEERRSLVQLEPSSFGEDSNTGFLLFELEDGTVISDSYVACAQHPFVVRAANLEEARESKTALAAMLDAIDGVKEQDCLQLVLRGSAPLGVYFSVDELARILSKRFFYVEVIDERTVAVDEKELEDDLTLMAEFIRLVSGDDTLSSTEKARIMRCGWNVLNGKVLAE